MVLMVRQIVGFALAIVGFLGTIIVCALPIWKVYGHLIGGCTPLVPYVIWEGLWMSCLKQFGHGANQMRCKLHDSLTLPHHMQAARALVVIAIVVGASGIVLGIAAVKRFKFVERAIDKAKMAIATGIIFICAGVLVLVPVCWSAIAIIRDFYNPILPYAQRGELGAALYIGWGTAGLLILGGALLCSSCPAKDDSNYPVKFSRARSTATFTAYVHLS